jgi:signal transduction histidine kinase/ActR/RegA family two-component response regulator
MPTWDKKKPEDRPPEKGVARAAAEGASHEELMREAMRVLSKDSNADRLGVWFEPQPAQKEETSFPPSFRGMIWERGVEATPAEWARLSPEFPLPQELFTGKSVEQNLGGPPARSLLGPLMGMRRALWVPVGRTGRLRGVLLAGTRARQGVLPQALLESVAAEVLLAVELDEERRTAREQQADLALAAEIMTTLGKSGPEGSILAKLADHCTESGDHGRGLDAVFAVVGRRSLISGGDAHAAEMTFPWKSGDTTWTRAVERGPLAGVWKNALEDRKVAGSEPQSSWPRGEVGRVVALPLEADGEMLGVLVAGLRSGASLAVLARLEFRASLAAAALARERRRDEDERREAWQRQLLDSGQEVILLNGRAEIAGLSRGAREQLKESSENRTEKQKTAKPALQQTEKLAALGQMVTGVAHELSNPLTSILGYAQRLLLRGDAAGRTEEAQKIYQEAERASTILRQLLLNARETRPEKRRVSLNQVVLQTVELQRFGLPAERIRLNLELDPVPPSVQGDAGQLQQVLMNLVGNARQAIEESGKGGNIWVRTKRTDEGRVLLEVGDDGPGIPEAIMARIFDPFFTTKPAGVGTGLGLAIALGIVREHGGQMKVSSPPGGGAVFTIELPATSEAGIAPARSAEAGERRARVSRAEHAADPGTARPSVLVVEDEPTVARLIADVLEDEGMSAEVLMDGRAALDRAAREHYDLAICDMKMPGLDGQNFYKALVRAGNSLRGRFLFVTGDVIAPRTRKFLKRYHLPHVAKPFRVEELTEKVKQVLARKTPRRSMTAATPAAGTKKNAARNG